MEYISKSLRMPSTDRGQQQAAKLSDNHSYHKCLIEKLSLLVYSVQPTRLNLPPEHAGSLGLRYQGEEETPMLHRIVRSINAHVPWIESP